jgi:hypothetical protein
MLMAEVETPMTMTQTPAEEPRGTASQASKDVNVDNGKLKSNPSTERE